MDRRLQTRYYQLVQEHAHIVTATTTGLSALPGTKTAFSSTQALWRFLNNPATTLPGLLEPVREASRAVLWACPGPFALVAHDWSMLNFGGHRSKTDRFQRSQAHDIGYELGSALLLNPNTGQPLGPLELRLKTAKGLYSTRPAGAEPASHVNEVFDVLQASRAWGLKRVIVHLIDREGDSLGHYRQWHAAGHYFVVRGDAHRRIRWQGQKMLLPDLARQLWTQGTFIDTGQDVQVQKTQGRLWVAETTLVLDQPARRRIGGRIHTCAGEPLTLRLVFTRVVTAAGAVLAEWFLWTNVSTAVTMTTVAQWYAWRWRIESYFKLLKSAGHHVEAWEQTTGLALAKRLVIASMACLTVWLLQQDPTPPAATLRRLLVRLSGRQMKYRVPATAPALLAGLEKLLATLDLLQHYSLAELHCLVHQCLPHLFNSS